MWGNNDRVLIQTTYGGYGGFAGISRRGVGHIGPQKDDRLTEHQGSEKINP